MIKIKTKKLIGHRFSDIGPGGKEYNIETDKIWREHQKKKRK